VFPGVGIVVMSFVTTQSIVASKASTQSVAFVNVINL
jgi:hypothetical protein